MKNILNFTASLSKYLKEKKFVLFLNQNAKALKAKKEEGNQAFKNNNYEAAYQLYTEALTIDPNNIKTNAKLYCNRATAGAKVNATNRLMFGCSLGKCCCTSHVHFIHNAVILFVYMEVRFVHLFVSSQFTLNRVSTKVLLV